MQGSAESRGPGRRPRPLAPPRLPPGALREFKRALYRLYLAAGTPSLEAVAEAVGADDALPGAPAKDTVHRILGGTKLPGLHDAESVAIVLARAGGTSDPAQVAVRTRELWIAAQENPGPALRTAEDWGAFRLGVHRAVAVDGSGFDALTPYLARKHDEVLRERLRHAADGGQSVCALLVGQSSTGKSRAAFEAIRDELGSWPVLVPQSPAELVEWIATDSVDARTVVWLDEAQRHLTEPADEGPVRALTELLGQVAPLVVLGTIWPEYARKLTSRAVGGPDRYPHARGLLETHRAEIHVPDSLGDDLEQARRIAVRDPRMRAAVEAARRPGGERARVIQQLTGGPELVRRYETGPGNAFSEIEYAVVTAAVDARRLGHGSALPAELLAEAAAGYLPTTARVTHDHAWFATAVESLCAQESGALSALVPDRVAPGLGAADGYHPADYLDQGVRRLRARLAPPEQLWQAAAAHARTVDDLYAMGRAAQDRQRHAAAALLHRRAVERGGEVARPALARLLELSGDRTGAESAAAEHTSAWTGLAVLRESAGDRDSAVAAYTRAAAGGERQAWAALARMRAEDGDRAGAEDTAERAARAGHTQAWLMLARRRERAADLDGATAAYARAAAAGDPWGLIGAARLAERAGDRGAADAGYRAAAEAGVTTAEVHLVRSCWAAGDAAGAEAAAERAADGRDIEGWSVLARLRGDDGDTDGAARAWTRAAAAGSTGALARLARLSEEKGDRAEAERAARRAAWRGDAEAWVVLARLRAEAGDPAADAAASAAAQAGDTEACTVLARLRETAGDREGAERAANEAAEHGDPEAWSALARIRERADDSAGARAAVDRASDAGGTGAWTALGRVREGRGDLDGAEQAYRTAMSQGDIDACGALARLCEDNGDLRRAAELYRTAVDAGDTEAWEALSQLA
ncbi:hypothetical protein [Streptomyces boluensis]|uniref:Uncharacterized protein n=1 Tax=Streptomyces boluensis TaxID=1775135 RepID=A0A964XP82_9ACTN|nr:hypothetical protein [Streptomyces boluensis]NBE54532.1 hypothetical protein [Streptomyces boluensis]